jgi:succinate dehydrogenase hydrophobic anchor subunit
MNFISTSQDILFLTLALCALLLTIFLIWLLYYAIMSFRQTYHSIKKIKAKIDALDEIITMIRERLTSTMSYFTLIISGIKKMIELLSDNEEEPKTKKKKHK